MCVVHPPQFRNNLSDLILLLLIQFDPFLWKADTQAPPMKLSQVWVANASRLEVVNIPPGVVAR